MIEHRIKGAPIEIGFEWRQRLRFTVPMFPIGCRLVAHVRATPRDPAPLAVLTTENGGLVIVDTFVVELAIAPEVSAALPPGTIVTSIVRIDIEPHAPLGITLRVPVVVPITRPPL